jgi:hypothetical protein
MANPFEDLNKAAFELSHPNGDPEIQKQEAIKFNREHFTPQDEMLRRILNLYGETLKIAKYNKKEPSITVLGIRSDCPGADSTVITKFPENLIWGLSLGQYSLKDPYQYMTKKLSLRIELANNHLNNQTFIIKEVFKVETMSVGRIDSEEVDSFRIETPDASEQALILGLQAHFKQRVLKQNNVSTSK